MRRILPGREEDHRWRLWQPRGGWHAATSLRVMPMVFLALSMMFVVPAPAQTDTVRVPSDVSTNGNLNTAVRTAISAGTLSNTVFALEPNGYYVLTGTITVPAGERLTITAPEPGGTQHTALPQIVFADSIQPENARFNFDCFGDIVLKNVWLLYANTAGAQVGASLQIEDSPDTTKGQVGLFDDVIFDYSSCPWNGSGAVGVTARHFRGTFRNCYFRNCTDIHYQYYGRAVSFPYGSYRWHIDSLLFENCTFANMGLVYMQEGGEYGDNVHFNHCTFLNVIMHPLESGWWYKLSVTNSIFVSTWMYGVFPILSGQSGPNGGTFTIDSVSDFGFAVPFTEYDRRILFTHSSYFIEEWLRDWMYNNPESVRLRAEGRLAEVPVPQPMLSPRTLRFFDSTANGQKLFPYMNKAYLYDSTDPGFVLPPTNQIGIKTFLYMKWWCCSDTTWACFPDLSLQHIWPLKENLAYTNPTLLTAGMGDFPLGDLYHWFPDKYSQWKSQEEIENARISTWLSTGADPGSVVDVKEQPGNNSPASFVLSQNYPNPFNPTTVINYTIGGVRDQGSGVTDVRLGVYDLLGREVAVLVNEWKAAGSYEVVFDAADLASGVYLCRLQAPISSGQAGTFVDVKKLVVLK